MTHRNKILYTLILVFSILLVAILVTAYPIQFGLCKTPYTWKGIEECRTIKAEALIAFIGFLAITLFLPLLILLFCRESTYHSWKKFSLWYFGIFGILLSPIIIDTLFSGSAGGSGGGLMSNPASVDVGADVLILGLYFLLSLIVIIRAQLRAKKQGVE